MSPPDAGRRTLEPHDLERRVRLVLRNVGRLAVDSDLLRPDADLYDAGLKSLAAVQVMLGLEDEFGIEFPESMLHRDGFSTVARMSETVSSLVTGAAGSKGRD